MTWTRKNNILIFLVSLGDNSNKIIVFSVDLVFKEELNLMPVYSSQGVVGLSY